MIVIKNVKTPKTCYECPFGLGYYIKHGERLRFACSITDKDMTITKRNRYCPIVDDEEVEPIRHGKWIENDNGTYSCSECKSWIPKEQHYYARYCLYCGARMGQKNELV